MSTVRFYPDYPSSDSDTWLYRTSLSSLKLVYNSASIPTGLRYIFCSHSATDAAIIFTAGGSVSVVAV